jgi:hypothetical protein
MDRVRRWLVTGDQIGQAFMLMPLVLVMIGLPIIIDLLSELRKQQ